MELSQRVKSIHSYYTAVRAAKAAAPETRLSYISPLYAIGFHPGCTSTSIAELLNVTRQTASGRVSHLCYMGYIRRADRHKLYLTEKGETVFNTVDKEVGMYLDTTGREIVKAAAKYRKEQEQRRPEKGEIVLLYDGCPPDLLTRQRKRKRKTKNIKS